MPGWLSVLFWWGAFAGVHLVLSSLPIRRPLIARLGARGFQSVYSLLVLASLIGLVRAYWANKHAGPLLWTWSAVPGLRDVAVVLSGAGVALFVASLFPSRASDSPPGEPRRARGFTRIMRHPGFTALGLWGLAHALANGYLSDVIFFGGFPLFGLVGGIHQDARKRVSEGDGLRTFYAETSFLPFGAIIGGRNRLVAGEIPWHGVAIGLGVAATVYVFHARLFGG
jgi:uncharacterized membrane protein